MGYPTNIEWTDSTWNPVGGCSIESPGCINCYAQDLAGTRLAEHPLYAGTTTMQKGRPVFNGSLTVASDDHPVWKWPLKWRGAKQPRLGADRPSLIFVGDMSDLFHATRPIRVIDRVAEGIVHSRHIGQLLTKRPDVMASYFESRSGTAGQDAFGPMLIRFNDAVLRHFWLGTSAERQPEFDARWPHLRRLARWGLTVFISYEPALGPLVLPRDFLALGSRAQVICGGESGKHKRPVNVEWFRAVQAQCASAGVAFFMKQIDKIQPIPSDLMIREFPPSLPRTP